VAEIRIPSEQAFRNRARQLVDGFVLDGAIHARIAAL
jgi:hypothetical protein